jgi:tRNA(Arg) A34 adenosine deaminase TadA
MMNIRVLSNSKRKIFENCICEAEKSVLQFKHGCVATIGGKVIERGCNTIKNFSKKDEFIQNTCSMHAEINVLRKLHRKASKNKKLRKLKRVVLYISRINHTEHYDKNYDSAPCMCCIDVIRKLKVKKIIFCLNNEFHIMKPTEYSHQHVTSGTRYISRL